MIGTITSVESDRSSCLRRFTSSSTKKKLKLSLNPKASSSNGSIPRATEEHASEDFPVNTAQVSSGSSSIPNSPMSSEETFLPPPKTPSSPNDSCAVPSCKKGSQSSSGKPRKVLRSSADLLSSAKKPQPFTCPDPTSPARNNNPQACPQANPSEKSVSNSHPCRTRHMQNLCSCYLFTMLDYVSAMLCSLLPMYQLCSIPHYIVQSMQNLC